MMPPFITYDNQHTSNSSPISPSTPVSPSIDSRTFRSRHNISGSEMISVELGSTLHHNNISNKKYYKGKARSKFSLLSIHTIRKYQQQPRWMKLVFLFLGLFFLFSYVPFFNFVKDVPISNIPTSSSAHNNINNNNNPITPYPPDNSIRNQILLYRIIGNDLPPRHKEGQTLSNLQFILEHEPEFPNTRKIFLLNRISNAANEASIIRLLDRFNKEYVRIPFDEDVYSQLDFRLEDFTEPDFLHSDDYRRYSKVAKLRALDYTYHDKNLYAMNNNGGRNMAIEHAKSIQNAKWIMPFDGNCYLSNNGFHEIINQLDNYGTTTKYFIVPMTRLLDNSVLLNNLDERPKAPEEPQIIFRYDATEVYNLNMRYGRRSKLELLWTLGALENRRLSKPTVPWEPVERPYSSDKGNFRSIGWVFRLFSGNPQQEENKKEASSIRAFNRLLAIQSSLDSLDESIARRKFRPDDLFLYNDKHMATIRYGYWNKDEGITSVVNHLIQRADSIVNDLKLHYPSIIGDINENNDMAVKESENQHAQKDQQQQDEVIYENLDNDINSNVLNENMDNDHSNENTNTNSDNKFSTPSSSASSTSSSSAIPERLLGPLSQNVTILTLAHYFVGNEYYGKIAGNMIRVHLLEEKAISDEDQYSSAKLIPDDSHLLDFLSDQGYSFPSLNRLSVGSSPKNHRASFRSTSSSGNSYTGRSNNKLLNTSDLTKTDLSSLLDCVRLLRRMQILSHKEYIYMQALAAEFLEYLVTSPAGIHLAQMADHRGVLYDLQVTSLAAFTDDVRLFLRVANRCRMRIGKQFNEQGEQPFQHLRLQSIMTPPGSKLNNNNNEVGSESEEKEKEKKVDGSNWHALLHYESLNLQYWTSLSRGIQNIGVSKDIWHYTAKNGASISHSVTTHLKKYAQHISEWNQEDKVWAQQRLQPLLIMAHSAFQHSTTTTTSLPNNNNNQLLQQQQQLQLQYKERDELDKRWIEKAVQEEIFGKIYDMKQEPQHFNYHQQDPVMNEIMQVILDDQSKGRPSVSPYWMLSSV
ncbi:hypothetical protein BJ944DRAFT_260227 [Cunninghamella echinulata]|nr:hypothetical protein BJ944DRAFT_260227 [Cunninghamella echinulata]